jgi:hypothetical protein
MFLYVWVSLRFCATSEPKRPKFREGPKSKAKKKQCVDGRCSYLVVGVLLCSSASWAVSPSFNQTKPNQTNQTNKQTYGHIAAALAAADPKQSLFHFLEPPYSPPNQEVKAGSETPLPPPYLRSGRRGGGKCICIIKSIWRFNCFSLFRHTHAHTHTHPHLCSLSRTHSSPASQSSFFPFSLRPTVGASFSRPPPLGVAPFPFPLPLAPPRLTTRSPLALGALAAPLPWFE